MEYDESKIGVGPGDKGKNHTPDNDPQLAERRDKALQLRAAGFSFSKIGKALNITKQAAWKLVMREIRALRAETAEKAADLRHVAHTRTEAMINRLWLKAMPNDPQAPLDLQAMDRMIRLMVFHARLMGYEEPKRLQVDINEMRVQFGVIVDRISKVIPEEAAPRVLKVLDDAIGEMEQKQLGTKSTVDYGDVIDVAAKES